MKLLNVDTTDNEIFEIEWPAAGQHRQTIRTMLDDFVIDEDTNKNDDSKGPSTYYVECFYRIFEPIPFPGPLSG